MCRFVVGAYEFPELLLAQDEPDKPFGVHFESGKFVLQSDDESHASDDATESAEDAPPDEESKEEDGEEEEILSGDQVVGLESSEGKENAAARIAYKSFDGKQPSVR